MLRTGGRTGRPRGGPYLQRTGIPSGDINPDEIISRIKEHVGLRSTNLDYADTTTKLINFFPGITMINLNRWESKGLLHPVKPIRGSRNGKVFSGRKIYSASDVLTIAFIWKHCVYDHFDLISAERIAEQDVAKIMESQSEQRV